MKNNRNKHIVIALVLMAVSTLSAQQDRGIFEIELGLNAIDVYLNNGFGLYAKAEESFITDLLTTNDWNINTKARDTYSDIGNKENSLPPISIRAAYFFNEKWAAGIHFSANYLDIIDLCYNAVGLPEMDFTNLEGFLRFSPLEGSKITPFTQLNLGQTSLSQKNSISFGIDLGFSLWANRYIGLSYAIGVRSYLENYFSETIHHSIALSLRL